MTLPSEKIRILSKVTIADNGKNTPLSQGPLGNSVDLVLPYGDRAAPHVAPKEKLPARPNHMIHHQTTGIVPMAAPDPGTEIELPLDGKKWLHTPRTKLDAEYLTRAALSGWRGSLVFWQWIRLQ